MTDTLSLRIRLMAGRSIAIGPGKADLLPPARIVRNGSRADVRLTRDLGTILALQYRKSVI